MFQWWIDDDLFLGGTLSVFFLFRPCSFGYRHTSLPYEYDVVWFSICRFPLSFLFLRTGLFVMPNQWRDLVFLPLLSIITWVSRPSFSSTGIGSRVSTTWLDERKEWLMRFWRVYFGHNVRPCLYFQLSWSLLFTTHSMSDITRVMWWIYVPFSKVLILSFNWRKRIP